MLSLFSYEDARRLNEERRRRALVTYEAKRRTPNDSFVRPEVPNADIIEITFGTACPESIGA